MYFTASFDNLTIKSVCSSFISQGNIYYDDFKFPSSRETINMLILRDNSTGKVYKIDNYIVTYRKGGDYIEFVIIMGRYYHPDYGYVTVSTTTPC